MKNQRFRNDINGLRAIAVIVVVLFHFNIFGFNGGFIGVDIFFVISGYLMTSIIVGRYNCNSFSIIDFYLDRAKRIIPALALLCMVMLALGWFILLPEAFKSLSKHSVSSISFLSNILYWSDTGGYFSAGSHSMWLLHTWSLSVEWQFYIIYPILIVLILKISNIHSLKLILGIVTFASLVLCIYMSKISEESAFYLLPFRAWEMLAGGLVFLYPMKLSLQVRRFLGITGLIILILSVVFLEGEYMWPGYLAIIPVIGSVLVFYSNDQHSFLSKSMVLQWIGKTSYSIYLWHWPIVVLLWYFGSQDNIVFITLGLIVTILLSTFSFYFVENKTRSISSAKTNGEITKLLKHNTFIFSIGALGLIGVSGIYVFTTGGVPERSEFYSMLSKVKNPKSEECNVFPENSDLSSPKCIYGNSTEISAIVLGDSHSNAAITAIQRSLENFGSKGGALFMGADGCFPLVAISTNYFEKCYEYNASVRKEIINNSAYHGLPIIIISRMAQNIFGTKKGNTFIRDVPVGSETYVNEFQSDYQNNLCALSEINEVYILRPTPEMNFNVSEAMVKKFLFNYGPENSISVNAFKANYRMANQMLDEIASNCNVKLLDPTPFLCSANICPSTVNGLPVYYDKNHLSEYGNSLLEPLFDGVWKQTLNIPKRN